MSPGALVRRLAALLVLAAAVPAAAQDAPSRPTAYGEFVDRVHAARLEDRTTAARVEAEVLRLTNAERRARGLPELEADETLARIARAHAWDMARRGYFSHDTPEGLDPHERIAGADRVNVSSYTAENLWTAEGPWREVGAALPRTVVEGWMGSPGHRRNLLSPEPTHLGVGVAVRDDRIVAAQAFARVEARLAEPLPARMARGQSVRVRVAWSRLGEAAGFALVPEGGEPGRPDAPGGLVVRAVPGLYRLGVYVRHGRNGFRVAPGPLVRVVE